MNEDFLRWVAEKSWPAGVCESVCMFKHFRTWRPNGWSDRDRGWHRSTRRNAGTAMVPVAGRPAACGTWHVPPRKGLPKIFSRPWGSNGGSH